MASPDTLEEVPEAPSATTPEVAPQAPPVAPGPTRVDQAIDEVKAAGKRGRQAYKSAQKTLQGAQAATENVGKAELEAQRNYEETEVKPLMAKFDKATEAHDQAVQQRTQRRAKLMQEMENMDTWSKRLATEMPHDAFAESSNWLKAVSIAAMSVGAAAQAFYGDRTNPVTDQIDAALKRDLMFQRMRLEKGQDDFKNRSLLLKQFADTSDHMEEAEDKTYVTMWNAINNRLEAKKKFATSPQMATAIEKYQAESKMKIAEAQMRIQQGAIGQDYQSALGVAQLEINAEKARTEAEKAAKTKPDTRSIPNWEGTAVGTDKEITDLRNTESAVHSTTLAMDELTKDLEQTIADPTSLLSVEAYRKYKSDLSRLIQETKAPGLANMGSRITKMQMDLDEAAYAGGSLGRLQPKVTKKLIEDARQEIWAKVAVKMREHGLRPSKTHPFIQE